MSNVIDMSEQGFVLILIERERQVEGYTPAHDDGHIKCEIRKAAECYARPPAMRNTKRGLPAGWPWERRWWKPSPGDRVRELVKAGALFLAERDRCLRAGYFSTARRMKKKALSCGMKIDRYYRAATLRLLLEESVANGPTQPIQHCRE